MVSCLLNIFGVIMFLRLGWVVGQAGIILGIVIILLSGVVTTVTTMSMAAICTNGQVCMPTSPRPRPRRDEPHHTTPHHTTPHHTPLPPFLFASLSAGTW